MHGTVGSAGISHAPALQTCSRERWGALCPCTPRVQLEQGHMLCLLLGDTLWTCNMLCPAGTMHLPHHRHGATLRGAWLDQPHPGLEQRDTARGCGDTTAGPSGGSPVGGPLPDQPPLAPVQHRGGFGAEGQVWAQPSWRYSLPPGACCWEPLKRVIPHLRHICKWFVIKHSCSEPCSQPWGCSALIDPPFSLWWLQQEQEDHLLPVPVGPYCSHQPGEEEAAPFQGQIHPSGEVLVSEGRVVSDLNDVPVASLCKRTDLRISKRLVKA